jgi:hypothetical protein
VPNVDRRKITASVPVDRRKSYVDVVERVLGSSQMPNSAPRIVRETFSRWTTGIFGASDSDRDPQEP